MIGQARILYAFGSAGITAMLSAQLSILTSPGPNTPSKPEMDEQQQPLLGWHRPTPVNTSRPKDPYTRLSAILGVATGTGALFAVSVYLRLPNYLSINSKTGFRLAFTDLEVALAFVASFAARAQVVAIS